MKRERVLYDMRLALIASTQNNKTSLFSTLISSCLFVFLFIYFVCARIMFGRKQQFRQRSNTDCMVLFLLLVDWVFCQT